MVVRGRGGWGILTEPLVCPWHPSEYLRGCKGRGLGDRDGEPVLVRAALICRR